MFFLLILLSVFMLFIGLISPRLALRWSPKQDRKTVLKLFIFCMTAFFLGGLATSPDYQWWWGIFAGLANLLLLGYISELRGIKADEKGDERAKKQKIKKEREYLRSLAKKTPDQAAPKPNFKKKWDEWRWEHSSSDQITRQKRAYGCYIFSIDKTAGEGKMTGSGRIYTVTLSSCTCFDFQKRYRPCKHMYRLAMEMGLMELPRFEPHEYDYTLD
ncbi:MAG: SWIM zinc finger family protein [Aminivibrio sp.]